MQMKINSPPYAVRRFSLRSKLLLAPFILRFILNPPRIIVINIVPERLKISLWTKRMIQTWIEKLNNW